MSSGKFSDKLAMLSYRQHFAAMWRDFIRENFRSPAHAADVFHVDPSTADNWWEGRNAPQGWVVSRAFADPRTRASAIKRLSEAA